MKSLPNPKAWDLSGALAAPPASLRDDLKGTQLVVLEEMRQLMTYARNAVTRGEMVGIDAPNGTGKTTLLRTLMAASPVRTYYLSFPSTTRGKQMWRRIAQVVVGPDADGTEAELQDQVRDVLTLEPSLLLLDEAKRLAPHVLLALCWLEGLQNKCGIVLASNDLAAHAERDEALSTRITRWVSLANMGDDELLPYLTAMHPIYQSADPALLSAINAKATLGNRRRWLNFTTALIDLRAEAVTQKAAELALGPLARKVTWP
jgi:hypothetical protein